MNASTSRTALDAARAAKMLPVVARLARRLAKRLPQSVDVDDLMGSGRLGLTLALRRCAEEPEEVFEAYARSRIQGEMLEELRRMDPLSRHQRLAVKRIDQAEQTLNQQQSGSIPPKAIAAEAGMTVDSYREATLLRAAGSSQGHVDVYELHTPRSQSRETDVHDLLDRSHAWRKVERAIATLPDRLRHVVVGHAEGMTLQQLGRQLGVSEARVCQLRGQALGILRQRSTGPRSARPGAFAARASAA